MNGGTPENRTVIVVADSTEERKLKDEHHVLYTADPLLVGGELSFQTTYCVELPDPKICKKCAWSFNCKKKVIS